MSIFFVKVQFLKAFISQKACGLDCILMVIPMNCDPDVSYILVELFNTCLKECFSTECFSHIWFIYIKMMKRGLLLRTTTTLLVFFLQIVKYLKNFHIIDLLITERNVASFLNFSMVSGILNQLQIFCHISHFLGNRPWGSSG